MPVTKTVKTNLAEHMRPGALARPQMRVPATIKDAMILTRFLGERYLWVDSFCIVQDDLATKQAQLDRMGVYYRHSTFTIIAVEGDHADHGLSGVPVGYRKRTFRYETNEFVPGRPVLSLPLKISSYANSSWNERAWTFQEALFSQRVIIFGAAVKFNRCKIAVCEPIDSAAEYCNSFSIEDDSDWSFSLGFQSTPRISQWPDIMSYIIHVEAYNERKLT